MISVQDALHHIRSNRPELGQEQISIEHAMGRVLSVDMIATLDMPPFPSANMDGYAVLNCKAQDRLTIIGDSAAGHPFSGKMNSGEAVRISTGAMLPLGADRILVKEDAVTELDTLIVRAAPIKDQNIRPLGSDFKTGETLVKAGQVLRAPHLSLCAASGYTKLPVFKKPTIALLNCGDELVSGEKNLQTGQVYAANAIGLQALLESWGADVTNFAPLKDNANSLSKVMSDLSSFDIIVPIGGASVGDHDLMRPSFRAAGYDLLFEQVAIRPGKPCWMGRKNEQVVLGLPGNPASTFVCAQIFLRALLGLDLTVLSATLSQSIEENGPRETYLRATIEIQNGRIFVTPLRHQESYRHRPQSKATALIKLPPMVGPFRSGDKIEVIVLGELVQVK